MTSTPNTRENNEIQHGKSIAHDAENIWGWSSPAGKVRAQRRANFYIHYGKIIPSSHILEIGCGTGLFTKKVAQVGATITAIDISKELLEQAQRECLLPNVTFKQANLESMDCHPELYDTIYGSSVLHHLNMEKALPIIFHTLKKNGIMIFTEPNLLNPQIWLERNISFLKKRLHISPDETAFIRYKLKKNLASHGFKNIIITPFDWLHPSTPLPLIPLVQKMGDLFEKLHFIREFSGSLLIIAQK